MVATELRYAFLEENSEIYDSLSLFEEDGKDIKKILEVMETFFKGLIKEAIERDN